MFDRQRNSREVSREALSQHYRDTRVRQNLPRRTDRGLQFLPTHHGEVRVGEPDRRMYQRRHRQDERYRRWRRRLGRGLLALSVVVVACVRARDPQAELEQAQQVFLRGDLAKAQDQAESGWRYYSGRDPLRAWEFRILDAKVLTWRGMYSDVFPVLNPEFPTSLKNTDLDFQRRAQVGIAYVGMHR